MTQNNALLEINQLKVAYGGIQAVKGVSLKVNAGEWVSLIGSNGAGKTTTMKAITGLLKPNGGDVRYAGQSIIGQGAWDLVQQIAGGTAEGDQARFHHIPAVCNLQGTAGILFDQQNRDALL